MTESERPVHVLVAGVAFGDSERERLAAVSPRLRISHQPDFDRAAAANFDDPDVEVLVGRIAPADPSRMPALRWLQVPSAGIDHLEGEAFWERGLRVTNARGVYAVPMAEYVMWGLLDAWQQGRGRRATQADRVWPADESPLMGRGLRGRTMVVVGYGEVGGEVGRLASALGMRVIAVRSRADREREPGFRVAGTGDPDISIPERVVAFHALAEVATEADVLVVTAPSTPRTRGLVGAEALGALPDGAWVINVGRGPVIDEPSLVRWLESPSAGGAVLDVFTEEPLPGESPLWGMDHVVITPHLSGGDADGWRLLAELVEENLRRYLADEPLLNVVDPARGY